jgi:fructokinase
MTILSLGEILWDVFPDREELGGAPFNLAFHASRLEHEPVFISAVGDDARGHRALSAATKLGIDTSFIQTNPEAGTGVVTVSLDQARAALRSRCSGRQAYDHVPLTDRQIEKLAATNPEWICFGTLFFMPTSNLATLRRLLEACPRARRFYDVNLRQGNWNDALVRELLPLADVVKLNEAEVETLEPMMAAARGLVCVTRAERGCTVNGTGVPGYRVKVADAVGAGDAFSGRLAARAVRGLAG